VGVVFTAVFQAVFVAVGAEVDWNGAGEVGLGRAAERVALRLGCAGARAGPGDGAPRVGDGGQSRQLTAIRPQVGEVKGIWRLQIQERTDVARSVETAITHFQQRTSAVLTAVFSYNRE